ncbi:hypothetical protein LINPERHAP2_LOCUS29449 [Linum perenne]
MADGLTDIVIRHGGRMDFNGSEPTYIGGEESVVGFDIDYLSYRTLMAVAKDDLGYQIVHRMWWLPPKKTMATGLRELFGDMDILYGLMLDVQNVVDGQVVMFLEAEKEVSGGWDNEDGNMADDEGMNSDDSAGVEHSVRPSDVPFVVVSDEFGDSVRGDVLQGKKRKIRTVYYSSGGEEVQQCTNSVAPTLGNTVLLSEGAVERSMSDMNLPPNSASTQYRQSSGSEHVRPNLSDEGSYDAVDYEPIQGVRRDFSNVRLRQGMKFVDSAAFKDFVASYCLYIGADILWLRSCQSKMEAVCREHCGWRVYGSRSSKKDSFILKCLGEKHTCPRALSNKQASAKWLAKTYLEKFRINPKWDVSDMKREVQLTYGIRINENKCYRARNEARTLLEGSLEDEYKKLRPYVAALKCADPEGQFLLEVDIQSDDKVTFKRIYIGFSSLFKGFVAGCRPIIGFDGCFLKGELPGMLLSAIGKDGNNQMFPLAWAVTEGETTSSWKWFVELVKGQLNLDQGNGWTVISDQQKGLIQALDYYLPHAEHRKCARHVFANWKLKHPTAVAKDAFWYAVYSSNRVDYEKHEAKVEPELDLKKLRCIRTCLTSHNNRAHNLLIHNLVAQDDTFQRMYAFACLGKQM